MNSIKEIRELTGLSQLKIAEWLGVSKSLIQFAEKGKRDLNSKATRKISAMVVLVQQMKDAGMFKQAEETEYTDPAKLAARHKTKMEFHQQSVVGLQKQLCKLKSQHPQLQSRLKLLDAMKEFNTEWYIASEQDRAWIDLIEWFSKERLPATSMEEQDLLLDKIETHLAYAELHKQRMEKFFALATSL